LVGCDFGAIMIKVTSSSIAKAKGERMSRFSRSVSWALAVFVLVTCMSCSTKKRARSSYDTQRYITEHDLRSLPQGNIPIVINERVIAWIEYFSGAGRRHFTRYLPLMKAILREQGMPTDLVYIALIESGFNNHAHSRAAAVGPWQFISSTGRIYGLKQDGWIDERRDPVRSTYAASKLFRDLYNDYGDWYLAMVGYNAGPGRVNKAMEITGSRDFWVMADHKKALRAETRDYVPKFIAAMIMAKNPEKFGFRNLNYQDAWEHESAPVETQTDLSVVAKCAGVSEDKVFELNSHLVRGTTPPGNRNYKVRLPKGTSEKFLLAYAKIPEDERVQIVRHKVRRGDTMYKIARKYGVSVNALASANGLSRRSKLSRGRTLVVPVGSYAKYAKFDGGGGGSGNSKLIRYKVRRGDTLSTIAAKYPGVTVSKLKHWNRMGKRTHIRTGQRLKIYTRGSGPSYASSGSSSGGTKARYHKVRRGETLGSIARKYGTNTKSLMALNGIKNPKSLRAGQNLKVRAGSKGISSESAGSSASSTYVVKAGDSPGVIAEKHGMSTKQLMAINGIKNPRSLKVGMKLKVKGGKAASPEPVETVDEPDLALEETLAPSSNTVAKSTSKNASGTHTVKGGETVGEIAEKYGMSTKKLMAINKIKNPRRVRAGTKLKVSGSASASKIQSSEPTVTASSETAETPKVSRKARTHRVRRGETLGAIARKYGVSTKQLMAWNGISNPRKVKAGQKLIIEGKSNAKPKMKKSSTETPAAKDTKLSSAAPTPAHATTPSAAPAPAPAPKSKSVTHTVKSGESLWTIARKHNVTIAQLQKWNNLSDPSAVRAGTSLKIVKN
jgi:membrane-bound lytic murein transglycosylase D